MFDKELCWRVFQGLTLDQQKEVVYTYVHLGLTHVLSDYFKNSGNDQCNVKE